MDVIIWEISELTGERVTVHRSKDLFEIMEKRVNLQSLGGYVSDAGHRQVLYEKPFSERVEEACDQLGEKIKGLTPNKKAAYKIHEAIN